ncbi:hypothetical protein ACFQ9X_30000 [Catenulispora yoronensis]
MSERPDSGGPAVLGVDAGTGSQAEADHLLAAVAGGLGLAGEPVAATHFVRVGTPHVALTFEVPDGAEVDLAAVAAAPGRRPGSSGARRAGARTSGSRARWPPWRRTAAPAGWCASRASAA